MKEKYLPETRAFIATLLFSVWFAFLYIGISIDEIYGFVICLLLFPFWFLLSVDIAKRICGGQG